LSEGLCRLSDPFDLIRLCRQIRKDRCCRIGNILIEHPPHLKIAFPPRAHPTRLTCSLLGVLCHSSAYPCWHRFSTRNAQRTAERLPRGHGRGCRLSCNCEKDCPTAAFKMAVCLHDRLRRNIYRRKLSRRAQSIPRKLLDREVCALYLFSHLFR